MRRAAVLAAVMAIAGCGGPGDDAVRLVPADATLYVHATGLADLVERADRFARARGLVDAYGEIDPWLGDEAAYARTPAGELTLLAIDEESDARAWADANGATVRDGFVVIGEPADGEPLEVELPDGDLQAWVSGLPPLFGDGPVSAGLELTDGGAEIEATRSGASEEADFEPTLLDGAPEDAFAYVGVRGLRTITDRFLTEDLLDPLLEQLGGEVALTAAPTAGDPLVTLSARVDDPDAAREALANLQGDIATALTGSGEVTGQVPVFVERDLGEGRSAFALTLAGGGELVYAVDGDRVAVSNGEAGVLSALGREPGLARSQAFEETVGDVPQEAQALAFLASSQLLELADEAGLDASETYGTLRADLARIRALGAVVRRQENDTTLAITLETE